MIPSAANLIRKIHSVPTLNQPTEMVFSNIRPITQRFISDNTTHHSIIERSQICVVVFIRCNHQITRSAGIKNRQIIIMPLITIQNNSVIKIESVILSVGNAHSQAQYQQ